MIQRLAGKIILLWGWKRVALAFLMGALASFALPPYDFFCRLLHLLSGSCLAD